MHAETPCFFNQIEPYVVYKKEQLLPLLSGKQKLFFYDACSFQKHAQLKQSEPIFSYIILKSGIVVVTHCILTELSSENGMLCPNYIHYLKGLQQAGITVVFLQEEYIFSVLDICFSSTVKINSCLAWAISTVHQPSGAVTKALDSDSDLFSAIMNRQSSDRMLFQRFFSTVLQSKKPRDNLGEELLTVCAHLLSNLPSRKEYQYLLLTEDKGAVRTISRAATNNYKQLGYYTFSALTTPRLAQQLYENNLLTNIGQIKELIAYPDNSPIKFFGSGEYELSPSEKTMSAEELSTKIATPGAIHINY